MWANFIIIFEELKHLNYTKLTVKLEKFLMVYFSIIKNKITDNNNFKRCDNFSIENIHHLFIYKSIILNT